jgi:hypothetical protein
MELSLPCGRSEFLEGAMKQSDHFLENAENCAQLAEETANKAAFRRYKRMEAAWRALAVEQDWLDGETYSVARTNESRAGDQTSR